MSLLLAAMTQDILVLAKRQTTLTSSSHCFCNKFWNFVPTQTATWFELEILELIYIMSLQSDSHLL